MEKKELYVLLDKYLAGTCSREEEQVLKNWYASFDQKGDFTHTLEEEARQMLGRSMLQTIRGNIKEKEEESQRFAERPIAWIRFAWAAAVTVLVISGTWMYYKAMATEVRYHTAYGEIETITLPDLSVVTLNGNSALRLKNQWNFWEDREVWLEGEAYFSVTHQANDQPFVVYTPDAMRVEVLGTEFNVVQRASETSVALASGKVVLHIGVPLGESASVTEVPMVPGEVVQLADNSLGYEKKIASNPEAYAAWKQQKLYLDHTSLQELIIKLEETHGVHLAVAEDELLERKASGTLPLSEKPEQLISNMAEVYDLVPVSWEDHILLERRKGKQ
ncbi:MAG: FecR domain-containing protein [Cyclobacteriaceae bacterium]